MAVTASAVTNSFSAPGVLLTDNFADLLEEQFEFVKMREWAVPVQCEQFFTPLSTSKDHIKHSYVTQLGLMPRSDDEDDMPVDHLIQGFDVTHTPIDYRLSVRITKRLRETDQYGVIMRAQTALARSARQTTEYIGADAFNTGFGSNAQWLCGDGMYLFDSARPFEDPGEGTWSNLETAGALTQASLATARIAMRNRVDERGLTSPIIAKKLIVPVELEDKANELVKSTQAPEDALNRINVNQARFEVAPWDYLTSSTAWFLQGPKDDLNELYYVWRVRPESATYLAGDNPDVTVHRIRMSCVTGCDSPRNLQGNAGA